MSGRSLVRVVFLTLLPAACAGDADRSPSSAPQDTLIRSYDGGPTAKPSNAATWAGNDMGSPVAFIDQNGDLSLTLFGSGSCPPIPKELEIVTRHRVRLIVDGSGNQTCTADYTPTTSVVKLDNRVDTSTDLRVDVSLPYGEMTFNVHPG